MSSGGAGLEQEAGPAGGPGLQGDGLAGRLVWLAGSESPAGEEQGLKFPFRLHFSSLALPPAEGERTSWCPGARACDTPSGPAAAPAVLMRKLTGAWRGQPRSQTSKTQGFQTSQPSQPPPLSSEEASETPPSCGSHCLLRTPVRGAHTLCYQLPLLRTEQERRDVACSRRGQPGRGKTSWVPWAK